MISAGCELMNSKSSRITLGIGSMIGIDSTFRRSSDSSDSKKTIGDGALQFYVGFTEPSSGAYKSGKPQELNGEFSEDSEL